MRLNTTTQILGRGNIENNVPSRPYEVTLYKDSVKMNTIYFLASSSVDVVNAVVNQIPYGNGFSFRCVSA